MDKQKHKKEKPRLKRLNIKELLMGVTKETVVSGSRFPNGTQSIVPVVDIRDGVIITEDGRYIKIVEVLPTNFHLKSAVEQQNIIYYMASYLRIAPSGLQIIVRTQRADIDAYCEQMERYYNTETNEKCREMILENAELVNYLANNEAVTRRFYIVFAYSGAATEFEQIAAELAETAQTAYQYLDYCGLEVLRHENEDAFLFKTLYGILNKQAVLETDMDALMTQISPVFGDENAEPQELDAEDQLGMTTVQDILSPTEADFTAKGYALVDGVYHAYLYISGYSYPTEQPLSWLSPLVELGDGVSLCFSLDRKRKEQILPKVAKTTMINRSRMREVEKTRTDFEELDDAISSGMYIKDKMNREGEEFYYMHTLIEVAAPDTDTLNKRVSQVQNLCTLLNMTARRTDWCHEQGFHSFLPLAKTDADIERQSRRNALTTAVAGAFPFSSFELCDRGGVLFGINLHNNSAVILDPYNTEMYSNGNLAIFGMSGAGKTYTLLLLAMRLRMCGVQVYIIAPEKGFEYRAACEAIGGQYFKISPGSEDQINPMEIRRTSLDIDSNMEGHIARNDSVLLDQVQNIHTNLMLRYPQMSPEEEHQLNIAILECYEYYGITKDNASLLQPDGSFKPMPDFEHLHPFLLKYPALKNVALVVQEIIEMGMGGQTNVDLHSQFVVLDTSSAKQKYISSCTHIATAFVKDACSRSRTKKKAVIADELWKIAGDEGNEQAANFALELIKTVRGYGGIFISATQNVIDYFALRDGKFGDAVLGNSRLKLLLQMEETEAVKLKEKLLLSDEEMMQIVRSGRGQGLLCAGKSRISVEIRSSQTEYDLITTNRADLEKRELQEKGEIHHDDTK